MCAYLLTVDPSFLQRAEGTKRHMMNNFVSRRDILKLAAAGGLAAAMPPAQAEATQGLFGPAPGWVVGQMSGAAALTETLKQEGCTVVFGIPGASGK